MKAVPVITGTVSANGRLQFTEAERRGLDVWLSTLIGRPVDITIKVHRNTRSLSQNAWWWSIAVPMIAEAMGYDHHEHEQVHYALVAKCFGTTRDEVSGLDVPNVRSSQLTTVQFGELMEWAVRFAAQTWPGLVIPLPGEADVAA